MTAQEAIPALVRDLLVGRKIDVVGFIDQLLTLVEVGGEIQCTLVDPARLRFTIPADAVIDVELDQAKGKLRMLCARLGVLCQESDCLDGTLYGGEGVIQKAVGMNGASMTVQGQVGVLAAPAVHNVAPVFTKAVQWTVRFMNTPSKQEFVIQAQ